MVPIFSPYKIFSCCIWHSSLKQLRAKSGQRAKNRSNNNTRISASFNLNKKSVIWMQKNFIALRYGGCHKVVRHWSKWQFFDRQKFTRIDIIQYDIKHYASLHCWGLWWWSSGRHTWLELWRSKFKSQLQLISYKSFFNDQK